jgi:hypothetical protein
VRPRAHSAGEETVNVKSDRPPPPSNNRLQHQCVDCKTLAPSTDSDHTLISAQHGWRLTRGKTAGGHNAMEWRCPACWGRFKAGGPKK